MPISTSSAGAASEQEFRKGIELTQNYAVGHFYFANHLLVMERMEEALAEAQGAQALDPVSLPAGSNTAMALYFNRHYEAAIEECMRVLEIDPTFARSYEDLGRAYLEKGMWHEAMTAFKKAVSYSRRGSGYLASLAHAHAQAGRRRKALDLLKELNELAQKQYVSSFALLSCMRGSDRE